MGIVNISDTDENADWIKFLSDDVAVSQQAKEILKVRESVKKSFVELGGKGSGYRGHKGVKGQKGGSAPSTGKGIPTGFHLSMIMIEESFPDFDPNNFDIIEEMGARDAGVLFDRLKGSVLLRQKDIDSLIEGSRGQDITLKDDSGNSVSYKVVGSPSTERIYIVDADAKIKGREANLSSGMSITEEDVKAWQKGSSNNLVPSHSERNTYVKDVMQEATGSNRIIIRDESGLIQAAGYYEVAKGRLIVKKLASAPWNVAYSKDPRKVQGAGSAFMAELARRSLELGQPISLDSLSDAVPFYQKLGFTKRGMKKWSQPMSWDKNRMREFLDNYESR